MLVSDWKKLKAESIKIRNYCTDLGEEIDRSFLQPTIRKAGECFHDSYEDLKMVLPIDDSFSYAPMIESATDANGTIHETLNCSEEYWTCVLGYMGRIHEILIGNPKLRQARIPMTKNNVHWEAILNDKEYANAFWSKEKYFLVDLCNASIQMCGILAKAQQAINELWQPPETHTNVKGFHEKYGVPEKTIYAWLKNPKGDPKIIYHKHRKNRKYFSLSWVLERYEEWKIRKQ